MSSARVVDSPAFTTIVGFRRDAEGSRLPEGHAVVTAFDGDQAIGALRWDFYAEPPEVVGLSVDDAYQRQGVATRLFEVARSQESKLQHSSTLTEAGRAFAEATPLD